MRIPTVCSYGKYKGNGFNGQCNYGAHTIVITVKDIAIWYSYQTPIAFHGPYGRFVSKNQWGPTTGKHLRWIEDGHQVFAPLDHEAFLKELRKALNGYRPRKKREKPQPKVTRAERRFASIIA
jgi:hypothetical protein